MNLNISSITSK